MDVLYRAFACFAILFFPLTVSALDNCSKVNCDCGSLTSDSMQALCRQQERWVKERCVNDQPRDFCGIHGEDGTPLALRLKINKGVAVLPLTEIKTNHKKVATMYWAIHTDTKEVLKNTKLKQYLEAKNGLKNIEAYMDNLFSIQLQVATSWIKNGKPEKAIDAWKDYSTDTLDVAKDLGALSESIIRGIQDGKTGYYLYDIAATSLRLSGYAYEMAGYAYGKSMRNEKAAQTWNKASKANQFLVSLNDRFFSSAGDNRRLLEQAASRLHRASYHWQLSKNFKKSKESYEESVQLYARIEKQKVEHQLVVD